MNVHDKEWSSSSWGGSYSHQRHSPLPSPIHPSQHHHAAVPPPPSTSQQPSAAPEVASNYMSYYYSYVILFCKGGFGGMCVDGRGKKGGEARERERRRIFLTDHIIKKCNIKRAPSCVYK